MRLRIWANEQRFQYLRFLDGGKSTTMTLDRIEKLMSLGIFEWSVERLEKDEDMIAVNHVKDSRNFTLRAVYQHWKEYGPILVIIKYLHSVSTFQSSKRHPDRRIRSRRAPQL